jgi:hypothetical protein
VAGLAWPGGRRPRTRIGRRLALASLVAAPPAAAWLGTRPRLDPVRFALGYLADEAAYGAGVYRGAVAERLAAPLLPRLAWRPLPKPARLAGREVVPGVPGQPQGQLVVPGSDDL